MTIYNLLATITISSTVLIIVFCLPPLITAAGYLLSEAGCKQFVGASGSRDIRIFKGNCLILDVENTVVKIVDKKVDKFVDKVV